MRGSGPSSGDMAALVLALVLSASMAAAQDTCDVVFQLDDPGPVFGFAFGVDYSAAGGNFVGSGWSGDLDVRSGPPVACTLLPVELQSAGSFTSLFYDDETGTLSQFITTRFTTSDAGLSGPLALSSCVFALDSGFPCPNPASFTIVEHGFPLESLLLEFLGPPEIVAISVASVTPRTPVCGDGFLEGIEECDDGGVADGDCCSSSCLLDPPGTPCPDASVCTSEETCDGAGVCVIGSVLACDDGVLCSYDFCDPIEGCLSKVRPTPDHPCNHHALRSKFLIHDRDNDSQNKLQFSVETYAIHTAASDLGDPTATTAYALCIFDSTAGMPALVDRIDLPIGPPWRLHRGAFSYSDQSGSINGIQRIRLRERPGKTRLRLKARGQNLSFAGPATSESYFDQEPSVTIQFQNSVGGCWSAEYRKGNTKRSTRTRFKARGK